MATNPLSADQNPDLSLASTPNVASGSSVTYMPTLHEPDHSLPSLKPGDIERMGIDPNVPYEDLNLAGRLPIGSPPYNATSGDGINMASTRPRTACQTSHNQLSGRTPCVVMASTSSPHLHPIPTPVTCCSSRVLMASTLPQPPATPWLLTPWLPTWNRMIAHPG